MSIPVSNCLVSKAASGDQAAYDQLVKAMRVNTIYGHYTQTPCRHQPPCPTPSDAELEALNNRLAAEPCIQNAVEERKKRLPSEKGYEGPPGIQ